MRLISRCLTGLLCSLTALAAGAWIVNNEITASTGSISVQQSARYQNGKFHNEAQFEQPGLMKTLAIAKRYYTEPAIDKVPVLPLPLKHISRAELDALPDDSLHFVKLGHSSVLLKVYGEYWLLDPVFSQRASPFSFLGPKRFHQTPISLAELPPINKVLISHNHYDHLDKASIKQLAAKTQHFLVPLGVEADLQKWGVPAAKISQFDWWQELTTANALIAFTPTQHFSGRGIGDGNTTLWGSWVIKTAAGSVYFSGDSGYFDGFKQIGTRYGPFDVAFIETGAYDKDWPHIHMTPEQSVQAHLDVDAKVMVPVHNGTFDLAFHAWYEPLERVSNAAAAHAVALYTPHFGQVASLTAANWYSTGQHAWWRELMPTAQRQDELLAE
ncbi:MAG: L-ascorbate metabolism protein UlaG (beta-lactamase superfamily) [Rheinheimera aquimaris]|jgi:L-ascorbate metabolism protein UlaG (beta-lactamase superfamily)|nr:hydrolase [Rheinheimera sp.]